MPESPLSDSNFRNLGDILLHLGIVTQQQLQKALKENPDERQVAHTLVTMGLITEEKLLKAVSVRLHIPYFASFDSVLDLEIAAFVPEKIARKHLLVPLFKSEDSLTIGMANPLDIEAIDAVARHTGLRILPVLTTLPTIFETIQNLYGYIAGQPQTGEAALKAPTVIEIEHGFQEGSARRQAPKKAPPKTAARSAPRPAAHYDDSSAVDLADSILQEGMASRASDIHVEPAEKTLRVRFRVDGILQDGKSFPKEIEASLIARFKIMAKLDITETRLPQDGHLRFTYAGRGVDIRVSVLPLIHGEKLVLRVLDSSSNIKRLDELGLSAPNLKSFSAAIRRPNGIVLVTGPTGSGKTTTLYAAVNSLNDPTRNIITLEDPVEYRIDRINQVETFSKIGLTFAAALRSVLRQDPNVILVGEIRDLETAEIAVQAAITGHLVFSTLHTNDAIATVHRLVDMHIPPFLLAAALGGVMAQRLVRRLCDRCKKGRPLSNAAADSIGGALKPGVTLHEPTGCESCGKTGYSGRIAIHEWLSVNRNIRELILARASLDEMRAAAKSNGMLSLQDDALEKASRGLTSLAEVIRATREERED